MVQLRQTFHANVMGTTHSRFGHSRLVDFTGGRGGRGGCWQEQQTLFVTSYVRGVVCC